MKEVTTADVVVEGGSELWRNADLILFAETWETTEDSKVEFQGFSRVASASKAKKFSVGRGFGGLAAWGRDNLGLDITVEKTDIKKQFICLRITGHRLVPSFIVFGYFAPWNAGVYEDLGEHDDRLARLSQEVLALTRFHDTDEFTFSSTQGESVVDYFKRDARMKKKSSRRLRLESEGRSRYEQEIEARTLAGVGMDEISTILIQAARKAFPPRVLKQRTWFDEECPRARDLALSNQSGFRAYMNLVRAKKRRWTHEKQVILTKELTNDPQSFWKRLHPKQPVVHLVEEDLRGYVEKLYYFSDAGGMPWVAGEGCIFRPEEVERELSKTRSRRADDLEGLSVELLKWCGPNTINLVLNLACSEGIPGNWVQRRVVPIYKAGPKREPNSYRTIMIASLFSKLLGRLLEARLSRWGEEHEVRAAAQTGFRKQFCTLDHALVPRILCEQARRTKRTLYVLFIDLKKAFDSVPRKLIWEHLISIGVPQELVNSVAALYQQVAIKVGDSSCDIASTLGVIQGCPLSLTLFGLFIDMLFWQIETGSIEASNELNVHTLIFADDVAILAHDGETLRTHIRSLEKF
ncbi:hypothetical protein R1sor_001262 [Riccia sorocarpa]|uniref:Reverse transcriptase domain-containing protein n=1 Tax=Riccia sorocarpa TaxID=122646 RepID=A0ABD3GYK9_9MARC